MVRLSPLWVLAGSLGGLGLLCLAGYRTMIGVKPNVSRPNLGDGRRREIAALQARLMAHVRILGGRIGERHVGRPEPLRAVCRVHP